MIITTGLLFMTISYYFLHLCPHYHDNLVVNSSILALKHTSAFRLHIQESTQQFLRKDFKQNKNPIERINQL